MKRELLQAENEALRKEAASLKDSLEQLRAENNLLRQKLDALARRFFGKQSEQLNPAEIQLLLSGLADEQAQPVAQQSLLPVPARAPRARTNTQRIRTPDNLKVVRDVIEPDLVRAEPEQWKEIGEDVSRQLDYQPGKFFWRETVRPKYARLGQKLLPPVMALAPARVADRCVAAPGLAAHIDSRKYLFLANWKRQRRRSSALLSKVRSVMRLICKFFSMGDVLTCLRTNQGSRRLLPGGSAWRGIHKHRTTCVLKH